MKRTLIAIILSFLTSMGYALTCPPVEQIFQNGKVVLPPGWELKAKQITSSELGFMVAGWGDHHSDATPVACYYFDRSSQMEGFLFIQTSYTVHRSNIISHPQWSQVYKDDEKYYLCGGYDRYRDVESCPFN